MQGLREFPSSVIVPMMQISWTMFSILSGGIYFHEYRVFTAFTGTMFALGVAVSWLDSLQHSTAQHSKAQQSTVCWQASKTSKTSICSQSTARGLALRACTVSSQCSLANTSVVRCTPACHLAGNMMVPALS